MTRDYDGDHYRAVELVNLPALAHAEFEASAVERGLPAEALNIARSFLTIGDPDHVGDELQRRLGLGLDGLTISLHVNGHKPIGSVSSGS